MSLTPRLPLARARLDRDAASRTIPGFTERLWTSADTRVVAVWRGEALCRTDESLRIDYRLPDTLPRPEISVYLGKTLDGDEFPEGTAIVAAIYSDEVASEIEPDVSKWVSGRTSGHALNERDAGVLVSALAMANWHIAHRFSPHSGQQMLPDSAGWVLVDGQSGKHSFPRTDAAIIVLVTDRDDRIVLGHNAMWDSQRYSLLAGFVEPGESLEAAVAREVFEESGLVVTNPVYVGSQPWPYPASLMVGFRAQLDHEASGDLQPDGTEIVDLRWFSREDLQASLDDIVLPGRTSIARAMIEDWYGGPLPERPWR